MSDQLVTTLKKTPLFAGLSDQVLSDIAWEFVPKWLDDGEFLFHINWPGDSLYIIGEGLLDVLRINGDGTNVVVLNTLGERAVVGELAILRKERRSATIRSKGRSLVWELEAETFLSLLRMYPEISINIARSLGNRLIQVEETYFEGAKTQVWGAILSQGLDLDLVHEIVTASAAYLYNTTLERRIHLLTVGGQHSERTVCGVTIQESPLDLSAQPSEIKEAITKVKTDALVVIAAPAGLIEGLSDNCTAFIAGPDQLGWSPRDHQRVIELIRTGRPSRNRVRLDSGAWHGSAAHRVARLLLGRSVGLALGGGAAYGFAHMGILKALAELNVPVDFVTGASIGSIIGTFYAANGTDDSLRLLAKMHRRSDWLPLLDGSFFLTGVIRGGRIMRFLERNLNCHTFKELAIPLAVPAMELDSGVERVLDRGSLVKAIRSSISIPGIFSPYAYPEPDSGGFTRMVDGSVANSIPVDVVRTMGAHRVIGIHVIPRPDIRRSKNAKPTWKHQIIRRLSSGMPLFERLETLIRSQQLFIVRAGERQVFTADIALLPDTRRFGFMEWWRGEELAEMGYKVAMSHAKGLVALTD